MSAAERGNADQIDYWNGDAGEKWVREADRLDAMLQPFIGLVLEAASIEDGQRVLDVGCGSGALSRAAADAGAGAVTGVDVSAPMLALARERAAGRDSLDFVEADASDWQADQRFDRLVSRFGVMFFADPAAAFANLRAQMTEEGRLAFVCWQSLDRNDWALAPLRAALSLTDQRPEPPEPGAPGPFAFENRDRTLGLLAQAGWKNVEAADWSGKMTLPGETVAQAAEFATRMGPTARLISAFELDEAKVRAAVEAQLAKQAGADGRVQMDAAVWVVTASA